jgi:hypothetical protein
VDGFATDTALLAHDLSIPVPQYVITFLYGLIAYSLFGLGLTSCLKLSVSPKAMPKTNNADYMGRVQDHGDYGAGAHTTRIARFFSQYQEGCLECPGVVPQAENTEEESLRLTFTLFLPLRI